jgi:hypothetical protein
MNEKKPRGRPKGPKPPKRQHPLKLDEETRSQLAAAAYWTRQSANAIVEAGLAFELRRLQQQHNSGRPFPPRPGQPAFAEAPGVADDTAGAGDKRAAPGGKRKRQRGAPRKAR